MARMKAVKWIPTPTDKLISILRLMADSGGMLSKDRIRFISEAADRLEDLDERVAIMSETNSDPLDVDPFQEDWR